jgi:hypothetical protein
MGQKLCSETEFPPALLPFMVARSVTIREFSIAFDPRHTKLAVGRELTNGGHFSSLVFVESESADCFFYEGTGAVHAWISNWAGRFLFCRIRVFNHADISQLKDRLTVPLCAMNGENHTVQVQLATRFSGISQNILILATQTSCLGSSMEKVAGFDLVQTKEKILSMIADILKQKRQYLLGSSSNKRPR